jgi:hypothetical protein
MPKLIRPQPEKEYSIVTHFFTMTLGFDYGSNEPKSSKEEIERFD